MSIGEMIAVLEAHEKNQPIEYRRKIGGEWRNAITPEWNWALFEYRKAKPTVGLISSVVTLYELARAFREGRTVTIQSGSVYANAVVCVSSHLRDEARD